MKRPALAIIMGGKPHGEDDEPDGDEKSDGYAPDEDMTVAAEQALKAVKSGDAEMFAKALCTIHDLHTAHQEDEDAEEDEDGEGAGKDY